MTSPAVPASGLPASGLPALSVEAEIGRLRQLQADGRHAEALEHARALLGEFPENRDLLLSAAGSLRRLLRIDEALAALATLAGLQPRFSRLPQERGLCHVARRDAPAAIAALLRAVNINPALPMSWRMLEGVYRLSGQLAEADIAGQHVATLRALPPEVVAATALYS